MLKSRAFLPSLAVLIGGYHAFLITGGTFALWAPAIAPGESRFNSLGFVFNDMLVRLLHGDFTIDPALIRWEAVFWDGHTYAYFGVMPALLRLTLLPFFDLSRIDVSPLCCLIAATLGVLFKVAAFRTILMHRLANGMNQTLAWALLAILTFAGASIQFLKISVYQEAILWEGACASAFLAVSVAGLGAKTGFSSRRLQLMALAAGSCLITRVVLATGLYMALILLLTLLFSRERRSRRVPESDRRGTVHGSILARFSPPVAILAIFAGAAGFINQKRFGNPLVFHRPSRTLIVYPKGIPPALAYYGEFNPRRIPYGLMYYFAPVWFLHGGDGEFLLAGFKNRVMDLVEPPPSSFLLSDTLLVLLVICGGIALLRGRALAVDREMAAAITCGLAFPPLLMLMAYAMTFRYRMEFYPLFEFLALIGAFATASPPARWERRPRSVLALAIAGILASHVSLIVYRVSPFGSLGRAQYLDLIYYGAIKAKFGLKP